MRLVIINEHKKLFTTKRLVLAAMLAALTTAVGLCGAAGEYFTEASKDRVSYKKTSLIMVAISALVSSVGLDNIVTFIGPLLDACYPAAIVVVLYYVICPRLENPRLLLGARFAMIAAAVVGFIDVLYTYNTLLNINNAQFIMVALDKEDKPVKVPRLLLQTEEEQRDWDPAEARRQARKNK